MEYLSYAVYTIAILFAIVATFFAILDWRSFYSIPGYNRMPMSDLFTAHNSKLMRVYGPSVHFLIISPSVSIHTWSMTALAMLSCYNTLNLIWLIPLSVKIVAFSTNWMVNSRNPLQYRNLMVSPKSFTFQVFFISSVLLSIFLIPTIYFG